MSSATRNPEYADISWEGDSLDVISGFPYEVKKSLGFELRKVQRERALPIAGLCRESELGFGSCENKMGRNGIAWRICQGETTRYMFFILSKSQETTFHRKTPKLSIVVLEQ